VENLFLRQIFALLTPLAGQVYLGLHRFIFAGLSELFSHSSMRAASSVAPLPHSYNHRLIVLSILIAMGAAYSALDLGGRTSAAVGRIRIAWIAGGAVAMGFGIWSMHYIWMLAFDLPVRVFYDLPTVLLSLLAAGCSSAVALWLVSRPTLRAGPIALASLVMGAGICAMHYTGMAAMRLPATCVYDLRIVAASIVIAVIVSVVALLITFRLRDTSKQFSFTKVLAAMAMGFAVAAMHYTGMAAVSFFPSSQIEDVSHAVEISSLGAAGIAIVTILVFGMGAITSLVDRKVSAQAQLLLASESRYRHLLERSLSPYHRSTLDGAIVDCNDACARVLGYESRLQALGAHARIEFLDSVARETYVSALSNHRQIADFEVTLPRLDGRPVWTLRTRISSTTRLPACPL
jgi:NO-binding membrane sensor protein with MHYT domain